MSNAPNSARSFEKIELDDLSRLAGTALITLDRAFQRRPNMGAIYRDKLIGIALCQGAAQHLLQGRLSGRGVHDFDLWAFYELSEGMPFWNRAPSRADFGPSKFARSPLDPKKYVGRRVDVLWRSVPYRSELDPLAAIRRYFAEARSASARALREKPAIAVWPEAHLGEKLWVPRQ